MVGALPLLLHRPRAGDIYPWGSPGRMAHFFPVRPLVVTDQLPQPGDPPRPAPPEAQCGPPHADMQDHYGMTFGNSTRMAYRKERERKHRAL